jgi:hypothetical protein
VQRQRPSLCQPQGVQQVLTQHQAAPTKATTTKFTPEFTQLFTPTFSPLGPQGRCQDPAQRTRPAGPRRLTAWPECRGWGEGEHDTVHAIKVTRSHMPGSARWAFEVVWISRGMWCGGVLVVPCDEVVPVPPCHNPGRSPSCPARAAVSQHTVSARQSGQSTHSSVSHRLRQHRWLQTQHAAQMGHACLSAACP